MLVHSGTLRTLASCAAPDPGLQSHINDPLKAETTYHCKDDLLLNLGDLIDKTQLEDCPDVLVDVKNLQAERSASSNDKVDPTWDLTVMMECEPDGDWFQAISDREPLLPSSEETASESVFKTKYGYGSDPFEDPSDTESRSSRSSDGEVEWSSDIMNHALDGVPSCDYFGVEVPPSLGQTGEGRELFRSLFPLISQGITPQSKQKSSDEEEISFLSRFPSLSPVMEKSRLRHDYHRLLSPSLIPVCAPGADCLSCKKREAAVELEW
jgi:hypothetical protein